MRIVLVTRVYPTHRPGGMPFVVQDRAEALVRAGHEVHVVTTRLGEAGTTGPDTTFHAGSLTVHYVGAAPAQLWSRELGEGAHSIVSRLVPKVVHLDSFLAEEHPWWEGLGACITVHGFGWGAWLTKWNQTREAIGDHGTVPEFPVADILKEIKTLRLAKRVIGVSRHEYRMLRDEYGLASARLVYNPIPDYFFTTPLRQKLITPTFLTSAISGQLERGFRQADFACRGGGWVLRNPRGIARDRMIDEYDLCRALLLPTSYAQGYDLAVAEAHARGLPCVLSSTGSYLAEATKYDITVQPWANVYELREAILELMRREPPRREDIQDTAAVHRSDRHVQSWLSVVS